MKERSSGSKNVNETVAIKLVMCRAVEQQWRRIKIQMQNKELLKQLISQRALDSKVATLMEDIQSLKVLFQMWSFCLDSENRNDISEQINSYATSYTALFEPLLATVKLLPTF